MADKSCFRIITGHKFFPIFLPLFPFDYTRLCVDVSVNRTHGIGPGNGLCFLRRVTFVESYHHILAHVRNYRRWYRCHSRQQRHHDTAPDADMDGQAQPDTSLVCCSGRPLHMAYLRIPAFSLGSFLALDQPWQQFCHCPLACSVHIDNRDARHYILDCAVRMAVIP